MAARVTNRGPEPAAGIEVTLEVEGREVESLRADLPAHGSSTVEFSPVTLEGTAMIGAVRIEPDALPTDDIFYFTASPGQVITMLLVDNDRATWTRASTSGVHSVSDQVRPSTSRRQRSAHSIPPTCPAVKWVVLNDAPPPSGQAGLALQRFVEEGGGLLIVSGERSTWPADGPDLLPGTVGRPVVVAAITVVVSPCR